MKQIEYSVVIPVMNEEENVEILYNRTRDVLDEMQGSYEIIFVDDGSTDKTYESLQKIYEKVQNLKVIKFRKNFGQSAAMAAGFEQARGNVVISMDGDLQNSPEDIPAMVKKLDDGCDIVAGWRKDRKDKMLIRKVPSRIANMFIRFLTGVRLHDTGCSLKVYRSEIIKRIRLYGEMHRFIPALARIEGAKIFEMEVTHHPRKFGKSKYNLTRTFRVMMDLTTLHLFVKYLPKPVHFFGMLGLVSNLIGISALIKFASLATSGIHDPENINVLLSLAFLMLASGCQFIFLGLIASMVVKTGEKQNSKLTEYFSA